jgi:alpha-tubulin suppressor-like RCC1 family protein
MTPRFFLPSLSSVHARGAAGAAVALSALAAQLLAACDSQVRAFPESTGGAGGASAGTGEGGSGTTAGQGGSGTTTAGQGGAGECAPGETLCSDGVETRCGDNGRWGEGAPCRLGCGERQCITVVEMALGGRHTCALLTDGTVRCWGAGDLGQLGDGTTGDGAFSATPVAVRGLSRAVQVAAGNDHSCALRDDSTVACWGHNGFGKLGDGSYNSHPVPVDVRGLSAVAGVALGHSHSCAWLTDGTAKCWGINDVGQLGDGTTTQSPTPTTVRDQSGVVEMSLGDRHTCARLGDGRAMCWGGGYSGQLGDGTSGDAAQKLTPSPVRGLTGAQQIALGMSIFGSAKLGLRPMPDR